MDPRLTALAATQGGVFLRRQALALGVTPHEIDHALRTGEWMRIRRGAYVESALGRSVDASGLHLLRVHAVVAAAGTDSAVSHVSAAVVHGLDMWKPDLGLVHLTHPGRSARIEGGVHHHDAELPHSDVTALAGLVVTALARTAIDVSRDLDFEGSLVVCDSALRTGRITAGDLRRVREECAQWPGARGIGTAVNLADGRAQSVGESLARAQLFRCGFPTPTPQVFVYDQHRRLIGVADLGILAHRTLVEFDGAGKYGIDGKDARAQVVAEKRREDDMRELGYEMVRPMWGDLFKDAVMRQRLLRAFARTQGRPPPAGFVRFALVDVTGGVIPVGPYLSYGVDGAPPVPPVPLEPPAAA